MIKLKTTSMSYEFDRGNGYRFCVTTDYDPEFGWNAHVGINSYGFKAPEDAIKALKEAALQFTKEEIKLPNE